MTSSTDVNEGSTAYVTVTCRDKNGAAAAPATLDYRIDCKATGTEILVLTSLTPAAVVEVEIKPIENMMIDQTKEQEEHQVTFIANYNDDDAATGVHKLVVQNLYGIKAIVV